MWIIHAVLSPLHTDDAVHLCSDPNVQYIDSDDLGIMQIAIPFAFREKFISRQR